MCWAVFTSFWRSALCCRCEMSETIRATKRLTNTSAPKMARETRRNMVKMSEKVSSR